MTVASLNLGSLGSLVCSMEVIAGTAQDFAGTSRSLNKTFRRA